MAQITITVPDALVPLLIPYMKIALENAGVDTTGLTNVQIGRRFIVGTMRRVYEDVKAQEAEEQARQDIENARNAAREEANGII